MKIDEFSKLLDDTLYKQSINKIPFHATVEDCKKNSRDILKGKQQLIKSYEYQIKRNELLTEFIETHINLIEKELEKDGWCTLKVDYETLQSFKNVLIKD